MIVSLLCFGVVLRFGLDWSGWVGFADFEFPFADFGLIAWLLVLVGSALFSLPLLRLVFVGLCVCLIGRCASLFSSLLCEFFSAP